MSKEQTLLNSISLMPNYCIIPSRDFIQTHMHVCFSGLEGYIPLRSFAEQGTNRHDSARNIWIKANDQMAIKAMEFVIKASGQQAGCYVIPAIVANIGEARSKDIIQMQTLLIDIDTGNTESKLELLTKTLGQPTLIVESGGITECQHKKLHIYWQLTKPVMGAELTQLLELRHQIALP